MKSNSLVLLLGAWALGLASTATADVDKVIAVPWQGDTTKFHSTLALPDPGAGAPVPDSITFEILNTECLSGGAWEFYLNGVSLGTTAADPTSGCTCGPALRSFVVDDGGGLLSAAWDTGVGASNLLRARNYGGSVAVAWVRAQILTGAGTQVVCIFDYGGGNCSEMDLCSANYTFEPTDNEASTSDAGGPSLDHLLKGVIKTTDTTPVWYRWVFGDGTESAVQVLSGSTKYNVETRHGYAGAIGTPFTAQLCVDDVDDTMANAVCDNYLVQIVPDNLDAQVNIAIDEGLWYLYKNQFVSGSLNSMNGEPVTAWRSYGGFDPCATGAVVQSFEINNHKETGNFDEDPYAEVVAAGLNWLLNGRWGSTPVLRSIGIGNQTYGDPDANGNGRGIEVSVGGDPPYQGGMVMDCIIASQTPGADSGRDFDGDGATETYQEVVQDMVDMYAWGQSDYSQAPYRGGWAYQWNQSATDNSANQWAAIGLLPAQDNFGCTVPQFVKDRNDLSLTDTYNASRRWWGYRNSTGLVRNTAGVTRPSGMVQMILSVPNHTSDAKWIGAESWYSDYFDEAIKDADYGQQSVNGEYVGRTYYGWLSFVKAMRLSSIQNLSGGRDWYRGNDPNSIDGLAERLVAEQQSDGSWVQDQQVSHPGYYGEPMVAGWAIQMLRPALFASPPIACFSANPNPSFPDIPITFDPSCSDHSDTEKGIENLVLFEWDFDNDGLYDYSTAGPVEIPWAFPCATLPCIYPVTLRVTDDSDPPLTATFTLDVKITDPPHPPSADAAGPYIVSLCDGDTLTLDGSGSFDINEGNHQSGCETCPDDTIIAWDWDVTPPLTGFDDFSGEAVFLDSAAVAALFPVGGNGVGLRVTDNTELAYPNAGQPNLTHADFTTVTVYEACADCDITAEGCEEVTLISTLSNYEVLRSSAGPNFGFTSIGVAAGNVFVDNTVVLGTTYYYRLLGEGNCLTKALQVVLPEVCNQPPIAVAGGPYTAECAGVATSVMLDGSGSTDPDLPDDTLSYLWTSTCAGAVFDDPTSPTPTLTLTSAPGCDVACEVTLRVTDAADEFDESTATVTVDDTIAPVLYLEGEPTLTLECHVDGYVELGASPSEACDQGVTVTTGGDAVDTFTPGTYVVTYDAVDACGNVADQVTRTVTVVDTIPPVLTLNQPENAEMTLECHVDGYVEPGATVVDECDGSVTVTVGGDVVDVDTPGTYVVTYDATDASGNLAAQLTRTVTVVDTTVPTVTASVSTDILWSPDHKLYPVGFTTTSQDLCTDQSGLTTVVEVYADEREVPDVGDGTGKHAPDAKDIDTNLRLRAERRGHKFLNLEAGRVYLIITRTEDASGNAGFGFTTVVVPHNQSAEGLNLVLIQAENAVAAAEAAATASPTQTIADIVEALPGTWYQHGVSDEMGPHQ